MAKLLDESLTLFTQGNLASLIALAIGLELFRQKLTSPTATTAWVVRLIVVSTFLGYLAIAVGEHGLHDADRLLADSFRAAVASAVLSGVSWLIVPGIAYGFGRIGVTFKRLRQRRLDRSLKRVPVAAVKAEPLVRQRDESAGSKNDMQTPQPVDLQKQAEEVQRREDARLRCLFEWDAAASALENRFPRERIVEYFNTYMSTQHSVDVVEARAAQLLTLLKTILRSCAAPQTMHFESLKELLAHFDNVRAEIAATHADELIVQTLEAVAETGRIKAIEEYLKR